MWSDLAYGVQTDNRTARWSNKARFSLQNLTIWSCLPHLLLYSRRTSRAVWQCGSAQRDTQVSVSIPSDHVSLWKVGGLLPRLHNFASKYNLSHYYLLNVIFAMLIISIFTVFTFSQVVSEDHNFEIIFCYNWKLEAQVSKAVKFVFFCSWTCNVCDSFLTIVLNSFVTAAVK